MKNLIIESGITVKHYQKIAETIEEYLELELENILLAYQSICDAHEKAESAKDFLPQNIWDNYKNLELYTLPEMVRLKTKLQALKHRYREIFQNVKIKTKRKKNSKKTNSENTSQEPVQS